MQSPTSLSPQEAADFLNVSIGYLHHLLEARLLSGLGIETLMAYKTERGHLRSKALDELAKLTEEAGGYDDGMKISQEAKDV